MIFIKHISIYVKAEFLLKKFFSFFVFFSFFILKQQQEKLTDWLPVEPASS